MNICLKYFNVDIKQTENECICPRSFVSRVNHATAQNLIIKTLMTGTDRKNKRLSQHLHKPI